MNDYEVIIGLETHIQLNTTTKIFCSCKADSWYDPPNTNICPVCSGMPGVLPVLNKTVVEKGVVLAAAMHAELRRLSYSTEKILLPDLPRGTDFAVRPDAAFCGTSTCPCRPVRRAARLHAQSQH